MKYVAQKQPERILLVRFGAMGDIIHSLPAAAALRRHFPQARIDWLVEERWRPLLEPSQSYFLDEVLSVDTFELRNNLISRTTWGGIRDLVGRLRARKYEVAVDLQGAIKSALVCKLSGASTIVGFAPPWLREEVASLVYTQRVMSKAKHVVEANLELASTIFRAGNGSLSHTPAEFPIPGGEPGTLPEELPTSGFAVVNPGAGWSNKQWPVKSLGALCDWLVARRGMTPVLNCGPQERDLCEQVQSACEIAQPLIFSGKIPALVALLRRSALMVGPDTGPLHLSAALGVPTVGIYGPTDPLRNGPYGRSVRSLRAPSAQTSHQHHLPPDGSMEAISPAMVISEIETLLSSHSQH
jgi:heptosyltransferase I